MKIHPTAIIAPEAKLAPDVEVGPYSLVGPDVTLAAGVRLLSHVVVEGATTIGEGCVVHPFANLGGPPQHLGHKGERTELIIGPRNIIREHVTMHTGTASGKGVTLIGSDGLYMVGSHVAHDCTVGDFVVLAKGATLGGHVVIGDYVFMGGLAAAHQFSRIGRYSFIGGLAAAYDVRTASEAVTAARRAAPRWPGRRRSTATGCSSSAPCPGTTSFRVSSSTAIRSWSARGATASPASGATRSRR